MPDQVPVPTTGDKARSAGPSSNHRQQDTTCQAKIRTESQFRPLTAGCSLVVASLSPPLLCRLRVVRQLIAGGRQAQGVEPEGVVWRVGDAFVAGEGDLQQLLRGVQLADSDAALVNALEDAVLRGMAVAPDEALRLPQFEALRQVVIALEFAGVGCVRVGGLQMLRPRGKVGAGAAQVGGDSRVRGARLLG